LPAFAEMESADGERQTAVAAGGAALLPPLAPADP
jgi:hypothetical protein